MADHYIKYQCKCTYIQKLFKKDLLLGIWNPYQVALYTVRKKKEAYSGFYGPVMYDSKVLKINNPFLHILIKSKKKKAQSVLKCIFFSSKDVSSDVIHPSLNKLGL